MTTSGEAVPATSTPAAPATPELPEGMVMVSQKEHDAIQGDLRRTRTELKAKKDAEEDRERKERQDASVAAGKFDEALGEEREARKKADRRAEKALLGDAITDVLLSRNYTGEQATALKQLVDRDQVELDSDGAPMAASVAAAVDSVVERFPNLFDVKAPNADDPPPRTPRRTGPATPPPENQGGKPEGYVSPEEYAATPMAVRYTDEFRKRAEMSQAFWPKNINRSDLQQDAS